MSDDESGRVYVLALTALLVCSVFVGAVSFAGVAAATTDTVVGSTTSEAKLGGLSDGVRYVVDGPNVAYSNAVITPGTLYEGSAITANVTVDNTGTTQQAYNATLTVDGTVVASENGTLNAGASTKVTFTKTLWETGDRSVSVGGLIPQTVTVEDAANPTYHGGPRNPGFYPNQTGPVSEPVEAWNVTDGTPMLMQPTLVGDTLYFAFHNGGKLYAVDPETGTEKWNATPGGRYGSTWTTPAYANGVLYLGTNDYKLHAINATNGEELWNYSTQTNVRSAPAVVDGVVYFGSNDGNLTAVNATTGDEIWYYTMYQPVLVASNPAVVDDVVYIAGNDDNVTTVNATTGEKVWNDTLVDQSQSDPTVANGTVFVGSDSQMGETSGDGQVYALNATDGSKVWNYTMAGDVDSGQVYADGVLYAASRGGSLTALNASWTPMSDEERKLWNVTGNDFRGAPVVAGDVLYISDFGNQTVHAFNATDGTELWQYDSPTSNLYPTPLASNGYLYYGSGSHFYALTEPAPTISNVQVTNPSGTDVRVSFDSDTQLDNISVSISGAESATLTEENDFTETDTNDGTYTYTTTYAGSSDGTYTATVDTAEDAGGLDGASGQSDNVMVDTSAPEADAGGDRTVDAGALVSFDASESTDNDKLVAYWWDFGDGETTNGATATHTYASPGTYTVRLTVSDASRNRDADIATVTVVANESTGPTADAGVDVQVREHETVAFDGSNSTDDGTIVEYEWDFGDGTSATGATPNHTYATPGTYTATLTVTDDANDTDTDTLVVTVRDVTPPTASTGENRTVEWNATLSFDATNSSDNVGIASYHWDFGDGTTATGATPNHSYDSPGDYTLTLTASDAAGNTDIDTLTVSVVESNDSDTSLFTDPLPGTDATRPPRDPNGDGRYEDVDGDGDVDFDDAIALAFADHGSLTTGQQAAFDFDDDGRTGFADAVELAFGQSGA
ncbi:MAG: PKD domain-containing protein [Halobacteriota archaeon]